MQSRSFPLFVLTSAQLVGESAMHQAFTPGSVFTLPARTDRFGATTARNPQSFSSHSFPSGKHPAGSASMSVASPHAACDAARPAMAKTALRHRDRRHQPGVRDDARSDRALQRVSRGSQQHRRRPGLRRVPRQVRTGRPVHRLAAVPRKPKSRRPHGFPASPPRPRWSTPRPPCPTATRHAT